MNIQDQIQNSEQPVPLKPKTSQINSTAKNLQIANPQKKSKITLSIMTIVIIVLAISNLVFIRKLYVLQHPYLAIENELKNIIKDVGKAVDLPTNESPIFDTVSDLEKLRDQKFFANALLGDKVLVYKNNNRAILWRPSIKKVVEISTILTQPVSDNSVSIKR